MPSRSGAHREATIQVMCAPGRLCFKLATAGSAWITSPMAPSRTTSILKAGSSTVAPVYIFNQGFESPPVLRFGADYLIRPKLFEQWLERGPSQQKYVIYYAQRCGQLRSRPRRKQWSGRFEHGRHERRTVGQSLKAAHEGWSEDIEISL